MEFPVQNDALSRKIQQSEIDYLTSRMRAIQERTGNPMGVEIVKFGQATAFYIEKMPWGVFNSVKGLSHADIDHIDDILQFYRDRKRICQIDIDPIDCSAELLQRLARNSLHHQRFHTVLYGRPQEENLLPPPHIDIHEVMHEEDFDHYAKIHCLGSGMSIADKPHFVNNNIGLLHRPGWKILLARWHDTPAAVAVMHTSNRIASCTLAATLPDYRRNGLQTALLQRRMHEAYEANSELVVAQANFDSASRRNMERVGMRIAWTRSVWSPLTAQS